MAMKPLAPNTMIQNRYLVVQAIGKGGMGEVYLAVDQRLGSAVALKRTFFNDDNALGGAFEREARILARLRHPVLPKVIDHFAENGDQFLVMEHISGDDMSKRLENANKPFPLTWVMFWADQMLDALSYLHSHEPPIVHRDIKPQNLKLTDENHIVLLDFGLSKDFDTSTTGNPLNSASVAGYSPHFASMEQIRGTGTDPRSDIYSLSATLYQLLTNNIPADALSRADALLGGNADPIIPLSDFNPDISPAVSEVILKGVALRQDQRFETAAEMQKALRRAFNQGSADPDAKRVLAPGDGAPVVKSGTPTRQPDASELATRAQVDTGNLAMDATLQMDGFPTVEDAKQSDVKTAIFAAPETPVAAEESFPEQATQLREQPVVQIAPVSVAAAATPPPSPNAASQTAQPQAIAAAPKKKSKAGLVVGGLIGFLLLAGIAAGGGWYAYNKYVVANKTTPTPTPIPSASPSPSPQVAADANGNTGSNTNTAVAADSNSADVNVNRPATTNPTPGTVSTKPTPQTGTKPVTGKAAPTPGAKATPKRDERTVILQ